MASWTNDFPHEVPGVYCVYIFNQNNREKQLIYIGSSKNIRKRVNNPEHVYRKAWDETPFHVVPFIKWKECQNYKELEKRLIQRLKPPFNLQYTGINYRSYMIQL